MTKNKKKWKRSLLPAFTFLVAMLCLLDGILWANKGYWVHSAGCLGAAIILAMLVPGLLVCQKLDKRFDQLENLLDKKSRSEEKVVEQDTEKSTKP